MHRQLATSPLVIVRPENSASTALVARPARLRERLAARLAPTRLDVQLAQGAEPEARAALALRAHSLGETRTRTALAHSLQHVLDDARDASPPRRGQVATLRADVLAAGDQLERLVERLLDPGIVAARGLAHVRMLLSDGAGPLYFRGAGQDLAGAAADALAELEPELEWK
jgi:hypothetical protein